jgi:hypothetical protein
MHRTQGTPVSFPKDTSYYAVLQNNGPLKRSMLFLYDALGTIAYQEILADACFGIASMPEKAGDRLLVGCSGSILEYSPITDGTAAQGNIDAASH